MIITKVLKCDYDNRKSFYGKAITERILGEEGETLRFVLKSYGMEVCKIEDGEFKKIANYYSQTTLRHINEFRQQCGLDKITKNEWLDME